MIKDTSGPAFPAEVELKNPGAGKKTYLEPGMSLRDYFAAKAINGICASGPGAHFTNDMLAKEAYALADAMLKAREA